MSKNHYTFFNIIISKKGIRNKPFLSEIKILWRYKMFNINKAQIRIDLSDYVKGIKKNPDYIDGSLIFLDPSDDLVLSSYADLEEAESEIDHTVYLTITDENVVIEYEYIPESENIYFSKVNFMGNVYPVTEDLKSAACYKEIIKHLNIK